MAKPEELYERWKKGRPAEVDRKDLEKVVEHYLGRWLRKGEGSHLWIVEHPALAYHSAFGGKDNLSIAFESGRRVKGVYVEHVIKAIECIHLYHKELGGSE